MKDLHVHTVFSDGVDSPEEIVKFAIEKGLKEIGFSDHSFTSFDQSYCMKKDAEKDYKAEISRLKEKYADKISVLLGIEQDFYSDNKPQGYDFVIGSVHYLKLGADYIPVDENTKAIKDAVNKYFNGDVYAFCEEYYKTVSKVAEKTNADIIGHLDLIAKFNEKEKLFDENNPRYISAWKSAVDILLKTGKIFEINTGAICRGYKKEPYPSYNIQKYIKEKGGKFINSSDSHSKNNLCFYFDKINK